MSVPASFPVQLVRSIDRTKRAWGPEQVTGEPDTPVPGDMPTAWASLTPDAQDEWLLLDYAEPISLTAVKIYETYNPGAVNRIAVFADNGKEVEVWSGKDPAPQDSDRSVTDISLTVPFRTKRVKLFIDSRHVPGWNEIDAVGLVDTSGKIHWAVAAEASSTYAAQRGLVFPPDTPTTTTPGKRPWGPEQATGEPDTHQAGDRPTAWASLTPDAKEEWIVLEYAAAIEPIAVKIYETYNPGAVSKVSVFTAEDKELEVWSGKDPTTAGSGKGVSEIRVTMPVATKRVKIYLASRSVPGWNEIDAVGLVDRSGQMHWATTAEASSTYAEPGARQGVR
jgi:hypothetical protein